MYLALLILQMGAGFLMTSTWVQIMTVPSALLLKYGVIMREEAYLHELFGDDYKHYQERVRRWI